jgi:hypothetical protein
MTRKQPYGPDNAFDAALSAGRSREALLLLQVGADPFRAKPMGLLT